MKNTKIKIMVLAFTIMLTITLNVIYALTETTTLSCTPTSAIAGGTVTCTLNTSITDGSISGVQGTIALSDGLELVSCTKDSSWEGNCNNGTIGLYTDLNKTGGNTLLSFVVSVKSDTVRGNQTISISDFAYSDASFNLVSSSVSQSTILIKSTTNTLSSLGVSGLTLNPTFSSNTTTYSASTNDASATINATLTDNNSLFVNGYGPRSVDLAYGNNPVLIKVNSESGSTKTYTINITRNDTKSEVNTMATLVPSTGALSPAFSSNTTNYTMNVNQTVESINFGASLTNSKSSFVASYGPRRVNLKFGSNTILFKVKSENGTEKTYTVTVTKTNQKSDNANLSAITLSSGSITFKSDTLKYNVSVPYNVSTIQIGAVKANSAATVEGTGSKTLNVGSNSFNIKVTAESGVIKTYTVVIERQAKPATPVTLDSDNTLKSLVITDEKLDFKSTILEYNVTIAYDVNELSISAIPTSSKAKVNIIGNKNLEDKSIIQIVVTAENSKNKIYKINIKKEEKPIVIEEPSSSTTPIIDPQYDYNNSSSIIENPPVNETNNRNKSYTIIILYGALAIALSITLLYKKKKTKN